MLAETGIMGGVTAVDDELKLLKVQHAQCSGASTLVRPAASKYLCLKLSRDPASRDVHSLTLRTPPPQHVCAQGNNSCQD